MKYIFHHLHSLTAAERIWEHTLQLGAIAVYMMNALIYRPGDHSWDHPLVENCAYWVGENYQGEEWNPNDEENYPMLKDRGEYFLSDLAMDDNGRVVRMPHVRLLYPAQLATVYNHSRISELQAAFGVSSLLATPNEELSLQARSYRLRRKKMAPLIAPFQKEIFNQPAPRTGLADHITIVRAQGPSGPDIDPYDMGEDHLDEDLPLLGSSMDLDRELRDIQLQMAFDHLYATPNTRDDLHESAYITLTLDEMLQTQPEVFQSQLLPFRAVHLRAGSEKMWNTFVKYCYPYKGEKVPPRATGRRTSPAFEGYLRLLNNIPSSSEAKRVTDFLRSGLQTRLWAPIVDQERLWRTSTLGTQSGHWRYLTLSNQLQQPSAQLGVHIMVRPGSRFELTDFQLRPPTHELTGVDAVIHAQRDPNNPDNAADGLRPDEVPDNGDEHAHRQTLMARLTEVINFDDEDQGILQDHQGIPQDHQVIRQDPPPFLPPQGAIQRPALRLRGGYRSSVSTTRSDYESSIVGGTPGLEEVSDTAPPRRSMTRTPSVNPFARTRLSSSSQWSGHSGNSNTRKRPFSLSELSYHEDQPSSLKRWKEVKSEEDDDNLIVLPAEVTVDEYLNNPAQYTPVITANAPQHRTSAGLSAKKLKAPGDTFMKTSMPATSKSFLSRIKAAQVNCHM